MLPFLYLGIQETVNSVASLHKWAVLIASAFVLVSLSLSFFLIFTHLTNYNNPQVQKWLIGVVFMVPVYSVESFVSLWNPTISIECDILRNCYEAFALYSFGNYLIASLGGEEKILGFLEKRAEAATSAALKTVQHPFPLNFVLAPWLYQDCLRTIKFGIVQYMIMKAFCALLSLVLELFGVYGDGEFKLTYGYLYITVALNFSQTWALYCLVRFYNTTHEELSEIKPLAKFLCFKAIVFATWWQGVIIALLCAFGVIPGPLGTDKFQTSLQDFVICIEMAVAAVVHTFVFPVAPYRVLSSQLKHTKYTVNSDFPSKEPLLEIDEVEEFDEDSSRIKIDTDVKVSGTSIAESVQDVVLGGGETIIQDVKITVSQAVEPMEKGFTALNEKLHQITHITDGEIEAEQHVEVDIEKTRDHDHIEVQASYNIAGEETESAQHVEVEIEKTKDEEHIDVQASYSVVDYKRTP